MMRIGECRICGRPDLELAVDMDMHVPAGNFHAPYVRPTKYPLELLHCQSCRVAQLSVMPHWQWSDHTYRSRDNKRLCQWFDGFSRYTAGDQWILDIGSNDGSLLLPWKQKGWRVLGVDPSPAADDANDRGVETINRYFDLGTAIDIVANYGQFDVITAAGVFFHLEDYGGFMEGVLKCLKPDGEFIVIFTPATNMTKRGLWDMIYHEHSVYWTPATLQRYLSRFGLCGEFVVADVHGQSVIGTFHRHPANGPGRFVDFGWEDSLDAYEGIKGFIEADMDRYINLVEPYCPDNCIAVGAAVKGSTYLQTMQQHGFRLPLGCADINKDRIGKVIPGTNVEIFDEDTYTAGPPMVCLKTAWNCASENDSWKERGTRYIPSVAGAL